MEYDPVIADLNRYLADIDKAEARDNAADEILDEWMGQVDKIEDVLDNSDILAEADLTKIVASAIVSGKWDTVEGYFKDALKKYWAKAAYAEVERRIQQSLDDEAESRSFDQDFYDGY